MSNGLKVKKRNGSIEPLDLEKMHKMVEEACKDLAGVSASQVEMQSGIQFYDGVTTEQLDLLSSEISISLYSKDKEYKDLAARIIISNHHKNTDNIFSEVIEKLYNYKKNGNGKSLINDCLYNLVKKIKN